MARISLSELRTRASTVDRAKLDATTDADIEAQRAEDGDTDVEVPAMARTVEPPKALRVRLGMTQPEMAAALSIPLGTWRNWEQGRVSLEPAAIALLRVVSAMPAEAMAALSLEAQIEASAEQGFVRTRGLAALGRPVVHPRQELERLAETELRVKAMIADEVGLDQFRKARA